MGELKVGDRVKTTDGLEGVLVDRSALTPGQWWVTIGRCTARFDEDALTPLDDERVWPKCTATHRCAWKEGVEDAICTYAGGKWTCRFMAMVGCGPVPQTAPEPVSPEPKSGPEIHGSYHGKDDTYHVWLNGEDVYSTKDRRDAKMFEVELKARLWRDGGWRLAEIRHLEDRTVEPVEIRWRTE